MNSYTGFTQDATRDEILQAWGMRVRQARIAAGLDTQEDLESALGVAARTVSTWERGISMCHAIEMYKLARVLGVTMDWLLSGDENFLTIDAKRRLNALAPPRPPGAPKRRRRASALLLLTTLAPLWGCATSPPPPPATSAPYGVDTSDVRAAIARRDALVEANRTAAQVRQLMHQLDRIEYELED